MTEYVHYGHNDFVIEEFNEIKNRSDIPTKPEGGLWASRVDTENGWKNFCINERLQRI